MDFPERFETYLQSHIHPDVQPAARRLTHERLGSVSMEAFLDVADIIQASHEALDADQLAGEQIPQLEVTNVAQEHFRRTVVDL